MNFKDFDDSLTFLLVQPSGQHLWFKVNVSTSTGWVALKFVTHSHVHIRMTCIHIVDPLTFHLHVHHHQVNICLPNTLACDQIPAKLMAFPSASAVAYFVFSAN